ncbi:MAG: DUF4342 domain-containing protein [Spirochaetia bacterium]
MEEGSKKSYSEEIYTYGGKVTEKIKELIKKGNVRKIIVKKESGEVITEIPLNTGVAVGGILALAAPAIAAIGAAVGLMSRVKLEIIKTEEDPEENK